MPPSGEGSREEPWAATPGDAGAAAWLENRAAPGWLPRVDLSEAWSYRELALVLAIRDLKLRYKQTALGVAWAILQPLAGVLIFSIVFGRLADVPSDGIAYPVFVLAGLSVWLYFSSAIEAAAQSLVESRELVTETYFPRVLAPLAAVLPGLVDLGIALGILAVFMALYGVAPDGAVLLLPVWVLAEVGVATAVGLGLWRSTSSTETRVTPSASSSRSGSSPAPWCSRARWWRGRGACSMRPTRWRA